MLDATAAVLTFHASSALNAGTTPLRLGNRHASIAPYETFHAADGYFNLAVGNDTQFKALGEELGAPELLKDPRFATNSQRLVNRKIIIPIVAEIMKTKTRAEWMAALEKAGIATGPINSLDQVFEEPQVKARGMKVTLPHPLAGKVDVVGSPMNFSDSKIEYRLAPPTVGQHSDEILKSLGYDATKIKALKEKKII